MKKTIAIIIAAIMILSCISAAAVSAASDPTFTVNGKTYSAKIGSVVTYTVNMTVPEKIENGQFIIYYPGDVLTVKEVKFGSLVGSPVVNYTEGVANEIDFNFSNYEGYDFTTKQMLVAVSFTVSAAGTGTVEVSKKPGEVIVCSLDDKDITDKASFEEVVTGASSGSEKKANTLKVTAKTKSVKAKDLKKKTVTVKKVFTVSKAQGSVTVSKVKKGSDSKIYKKVTVKKNGSVVIKKGKYAKKTYKIKISVKAKGNSGYKSKTVSKVLKIKVK